jgi:chromosome segregation ATPase
MMEIVKPRDSKPIFLEDVKIEGFKSFSEATNMSFQPGIGVIMGNNGVGKSNILDGIVWALGENDHRQLRCQDEDELFFVGSKKYPPAARIRIELNFKAGSDKKAPVLRLMRERHRDGAENYWVDDTRCNREEYGRALAELGLKDALKTIIRQEQINDLIYRNPKDRFDWLASFLAGGKKPGLTERLGQHVGPLFRHYLKLLMPEGDARIYLVGSDGSTGLEIEVDLPGNRARKAHQLSGGEKSVTSLALKLALFDLFETPFFLLDEVEPSLDYTNHKSMQALLRTVSLKKQLIMITHLRSTIELANTLHGVRTRQDGSSFMKFYFIMDERLLRLYKCC